MAPVDTTRSDDTRSGAKPSASMRPMNKVGGPIMKVTSVITESTDSGSLIRMW